MEVILIRHTRVAVPKGTCYGQTDVDLADTFEEEAAHTSARLDDWKPFDKVYSSPLSRAWKLAEYCGFQHPMLDDRLKEMSMGDWEMQRYDEISDPYLQQWYNDYWHLSTPGGESFQMLCQRVSDFLDELKTTDARRVAVFAHGGVLMAAGIYGRLFTEEQAWDQLIDFGSIERIEI